MIEEGQQQNSFVILLLLFFPQWIKRFYKNIDNYPALVYTNY